MKKTNTGHYTQKIIKIIIILGLFSIQNLYGMDGEMEQLNMIMEQLDMIEESKGNAEKARQQEELGLEQRQSNRTVQPDSTVSRKASGSAEVVVEPTIEAQQDPFLNLSQFSEITKPYLVSEKYQKIQLRDYLLQEQASKVGIRAREFDKHIDSLEKQIEQQKNRINFYNGKSVTEQTMGNEGSTTFGELQTNAEAKVKGFKKQIEQLKRDRQIAIDAPYEVQEQLNALKRYGLDTNGEWEEKIKKDILRYKGDLPPEVRRSLWQKIVDFFKNLFSSKSIQEIDVIATATTGITNPESDETGLKAEELKKKWGINNDTSFEESPTEHISLLE
jgi:hypothetical protein